MLGKVQVVKLFNSQSLKINVYSFHIENYCSAKESPGILNAETAEQIDKML